MSQLNVREVLSTPSDLLDNKPWMDTDVPPFPPRYIRAFVFIALTFITEFIIFTILLDHFTVVHVMSRFTVALRTFL